ncbi:HAMP domain-containing sensor histidine kinase [uncultured Psychrosphaera sp.]|uniref:sensor histidine kinase n=1 Tax=uncultured Psychrosphaera sp. TaxID=1403522 RepID=UPI00260F77A1|nr:HAMP domain-containing sensor histidine kinase [uncultured Psychrosphaera sp.]
MNDLVKSEIAQSDILKTDSVKKLRRIRSQLQWLFIVIGITMVIFSYSLLYVNYHDVLLSLSLTTLIAYFVGYLCYHTYHLLFTPIRELLMNSVNSVVQSEQAAEVHSKKAMPQAAELDILYGVFKQWPFPVIIFNAENELVFFNQAMYKSLNSPLCRGMTMEECGFVHIEDQCHHPKLNNEWKVESFSLANNSLRLITASYIRRQLQIVRRESQQDLIRILSHELNNSITPIASLADSILSANDMPREQINSALARIRNRSERLLEFIQAYIQLSKLPEPTPQHFNLKLLIEQNAYEQGVDVIYQGDTQCFADAMLFEQLIINVLKNAKEANPNQCVITVSKTNNGKEQTINIQDNGPGFSNVENAITPLYTTKKQGHGLGLSLCDDIIQLHQGKLTISNTNAGALLSITLP